MKQNCAINKYSATIIPTVSLLPRKIVCNCEFSENGEFVANRRFLF